MGIRSRQSLDARELVFLRLGLHGEEVESIGVLTPVYLPYPSVCLDELGPHLEYLVKGLLFVGLYLDDVSTP